MATTTSNVMASTVADPTNSVALARMNGSRTIAEVPKISVTTISDLRLHTMVLLSQMVTPSTISSNLATKIVLSTRSSGPICTSNSTVQK